MSPVSQEQLAPARAGGIDPRGPRFAAWVTSAVLAAVLLTSSGWLLAAQTVVFLTGALFGLSKAPYGVVFRRFVRPHLAPPTELEAETPTRFAQAVGAAFGIAGTVAIASGLVGLGLVLAGFALVAALLNAVTGFCVGCEVYLLALRLTHPAPVGQASR